MPTFEFRDDKSAKFWSIELQGKSFTVRFGKLGTAGQTQTKDFADEAKAKKEYDKVVAEKVKKGYVETASESVPTGGEPSGANAAGEGRSPGAEDKPKRKSAPRPDKPKKPAAETASAGVVETTGRAEAPRERLREGNVELEKIGPIDLRTPRPPSSPIAANRSSRSTVMRKERLSP
jgi:predicted DNA-binding WGR domain protein